MKSQAH